jgi:hypothetical protein
MQLLQYRQYECRRFSRSCLSQPKDVASLKDQWNCLLLYGGWLRISRCLDGGMDAWVERKLIES